MTDKVIVVVIFMDVPPSAPLGRNWATQISLATSTGWRHSARKWPHESGEIPAGIAENPAGLPLQPVPRARARAALLTRVRCPGEQTIYNGRVAHILACRVVVDLNRDASPGASRKHGIPVGDDAGAGACDSTSRMGQDPNLGDVDGADQTVLLILGSAQS